MLINALEEIDRLEQEIEDLNSTINGAHDLLSHICEDAEIYYSKALKENRIMISRSFGSDSNEYQALKELFNLPEPEPKPEVEEEKKEEETKTDGVR